MKDYINNKIETLRSFDHHFLAEFCSNFLKHAEKVGYNKEILIAALDANLSASNFYYKNTILEIRGYVMNN